MNKGTGLQAVAALGVVFGDIGTSPLYTLPTCLTTLNAKGPEDMLGVTSLLIWTLVVVVCVKYIGFILRADHDGEGGILALLALASPQPTSIGGPIRLGFITIVVAVGASMLFGDGMITPAISVLSAIEGIGVVSNDAARWEVPLSVAILVGLFAVQSRGTERIGKLFGPVMVVWFIAIGAAGAFAIVAHPAILAALDPRHAFATLARHWPGSFLIFGGTVLAVTGVEALYADLSHFGRKPIVLAWYAVVFPALLLNYLGQGAFLLGQAPGTNVPQPFYALTPGWTLFPMVALATAATVIASQALISGVFTLAEQAIALSLWPRLSVTHTSRESLGQVYVAAANVTLAIGCVVLVLAFRSSDGLAAAYGLAVSLTMLCTSIAFFIVARRVFHWALARAATVLIFFVAIDGTFVLASLPKIVNGGWVPLSIGAVVTLVGLTWLEGRRALAVALAKQQTPIDDVLRELPFVSPATGTMILLTTDLGGVPFIADHKWIRERAEEERIVLMHFSRSKRPYIDEEQRISIERLSPRVTRIDARFGFMEALRVEPILHACEMRGLDIDREETSFFYADPKISPAKKGLWSWQRGLFEFLQRNSRTLPDELGIRAERRIELGLSVEI